MCCWPLPAQSFSGPSPLGLETICDRHLAILQFKNYSFVIRTECSTPMYTGSDGAEVKDTQLRLVRKYMKAIHHTSDDIFTSHMTDKRRDVIVCRRRLVSTMDVI
jgi:hypothetical protein